MSDAQIRSLEEYVELLNTNTSAHLVRSAFALGIIDALTDGQKQADEIAKQCELNLPALEQFLAALVQTPLLEQYGEYFALSQVARMIPPGMSDLGDTHWRHLETFVRTGKPLPLMPNNAATSDDFLISSLAHDWLKTPAAISAAVALDFGQHRKSQRVLELGCGTAVFSLTFGHRDTEGSFVMVDEEPGLSRARTGAESIEIDDRIEFVNQDYMEYRPPQNEFDFVLLAGIIHRHNEQQVKNLIETSRGALKPDGELCIIDIFAGQDRGDRFRCNYNLELELRTESGQLHSPHLIQDWLQNSGFGKVQFTHLPAPPYVWGLILAPMENDGPDTKS